ncbi:tetratricopeptide repeat protein [Methanococcoides orientis]|uniref:tetratricopeptide repeat protein n=1 Tax=Methanococcoides orientis TaxID=2822137 RepID=UPI001E2DA9CA|nr:tetratricopeptide repeat protein [Methanococcoides orientis]UGV40795.1 tetratricopeptide repeat protein [Methanococcoides orientis]
MEIRYKYRFTIMSKRSNDMALRNFNKGMSLLNDGQQEDALECLIKAETDARNSGSSGLLVNVLQAIGGIMESDGRIGKAIDMYSEASGLLEYIVDHDPSFVEHKALAMNKTGSLLTEQGNTLEAIPFFEKAVSAYNKLLAKEPKNDVYCSGGASAMNDLATILAEEGQNEKAKGMFEKALKLSGKMVVLDPLNRDNTMKALKIQANLANLLYEMGLMQDARVNLERAFDGYSGITDDDPSNSILHKQSLELLEKLVGALVATGEYDSAKERIYELVELLPRATTNDPDFSGKVSDIFMRLAKLASSRAEENMLDDTRSIYETSITVILKLLGEGPDNGIYLDIFKNILLDMEKLVALDSSDAEKEADYDRLISMYEKLCQMNPEELSYRTKVATLYDEKGSFLMNAGMMEKAIDMYSESSEMVGDMPDTAPSFAEHKALSMNKVASLLADQGNLLEAIPLFEKAVASYDKLLAEEPGNDTYCSGAASALNDLAIILAGEGNIEKAKEMFEKALELSDKMATLDPLNSENSTKALTTLTIQANLSNLLYDMGLMQDARVNLERAFDGYSGVMNDDPSNSILYDQSLELLEKLVDALMVTGEYDSAKERIYELVELLPRGTTNDSDFSGKVSDIFIKLTDLASSRADENMLDDTRSIYETSISVILKLLGDEPENIVYLEIFRNILLEMEQLLILDSPNAEKEADYDSIISMYVKLCRMDPGELSYRTKVATLYDEKGSFLMNAGMMEKAIDMYSEASEMVGDMPNSDPSFEEHKAMAMNKAASLLSEQGNILEAIPFFEKAVVSYDKLLGKEPGNDAYRSGAVYALNDLATILADEGNNEKAKEMFEKALELSGKMVDLDPLNRDHSTKALAVLTIQTNLANLLYGMGLMQDAYPYLEFAFDGYSVLKKDDPSNSMLYGQSLELLEKLVDSLMTTGEYDSAKERIYELVDLLPRATIDDPSFSSKVSDLFIGLAELASRRADEGMLDETRSIYETSIIVILKLLGEEPDNRTYLEIFRNILLDMEGLLTLDSPESDKDADHNVLISMYEKLCRMDPADLSYRTKVATLYDDKGRFLMNAGRTDEARQSYNMSLGIRDELIQAGESPLLHEFGIATIKNNLGTLLAQDGHFGEAKTMFEESLGGYMGLFDRIPDDPAYESGAALALNNLAKLLADMERHEDAKSIYESALEIYAGLLKSDPDKVSYKKNASRTLDNLASLLGKMGREEDSLCMHESARELLGDI